jgi:ATP-dependent RNA helicase DeaD
LQRYGYNAAEISSDLTQSAREEVMEKIRQGSLRFLVATDVASRGIDLPELTHVIQYEPPDDPESYIHRAGRTGRAGASGVAISLVNALDKVELVRVGKRFDIDFQERPLPTEEEMRAIVSQRAEALLEARLRDRDRLQTERMQRFIPFLREIAQDEEALAGVASLLDDFYHENFHASQTPQPEGKPPEDRFMERSAPRSSDRSPDRSGSRSDRGDRGGGMSRSGGGRSGGGRSGGGRSGSGRGGSSNRSGGGSRGSEPVERAAPAQPPAPVEGQAAGERTGQRRRRGGRRRGGQNAGGQESGSQGGQSSPSEGA